MDKSKTEDWIDIHLPKQVPRQVPAGELRNSIKIRREFLSTLRDIRAKPEKQLGCKDFHKGCTCPECLSAYFENYRATDNRGLKK